MKHLKLSPVEKPLKRLYEDFEWDDDDFDYEEDNPLPDKWCLKITNRDKIHEITKRYPKHIVKKLWGWDTDYYYSLDAYYWKGGADWITKGREVIDLETFERILEEG